ncbi:DNA recombination protein RmuC [Yoonia sediminilitoris]|uniref:DNA recombination protein RmuC homolog n=1 Tax=Yoonia sediminilitoris TaxID=1286148 RepID=A0A2T6KN18_9RHOB|nr:DNA recombination protein RmuC [Yoonia sediminilitoris]PUB17599.1 DNA recombination protein RmuC [Yoonia sediminilitoris]RCW97894.1 DNA recombination protein RmuC [Yoonia sediminilitoris]
MIQIGNTTYALSDPMVVAAIAGALIIFLVLTLLLITVKRAGKSHAAVQLVANQVGVLSQNMQSLGQGQHQLAGNIQTVSDAQANAQVHVVQTMEARLAEVQAQMAERLADNAMKSARTMADMQERMKDTLTGSSDRTTKSLTELQERLATIDKAQTNIEKLSGDVLSLQDILSNKQRRGMFGEIQLTDIVSKALPADSYSLQATLSNGKRADCLVALPNPPGHIIIDAKFPLEAYELLTAAQTPDHQKAALRDLAVAVRKHIKDISEKYIIEGETADGAIMFLPSEAVYAELHARLPEVVRDGFNARVWIVSPTTCMATLNTMRAILKDARMREQAGEIRKALRLLHRDVELIGEKAGKLETHLRQAGEDVSGVLTAATRAGKRADRLDNFDFEELATDAEPNIVPIAAPKG